MAKDILIYGRIDEYNSRLFFKDIAEALKDDEEAALVFRINTGGGEPEYEWGQAAKINELENKKIKVDGKAYSGGTYACIYAAVEDVECLDVSQFLIHRAAYNEWFEQSEYFTDELKQNLASINKKLEKAVRNRIDVEAFENLKQCKEKNITIKKLFDMNDRIDVFFDAKDAKAIGLVGKIVKLTPEKKTELDSFNRIAKETRKGINAPIDEPVLIEESKTIPMTIEKLKAEFPLVYAALVEEGRKAGIAEGIAAERERVGAWQAFKDIDAKRVEEGISKGEEVTTKVLSEMTAKKLSTENLKGLSNGSAPAAGAAEEVKNQTEQQKNVAAFEAQVNRILKRKPAVAA